MPGSFVCPNGKPFTYRDSQKIDSESRTADNDNRLTRQPISHLLSTTRTRQSSQQFHGCTRFRSLGGPVVVAPSGRVGTRKSDPLFVWVVKSMGPPGYRPSDFIQ